MTKTETWSERRGRRSELQTRLVHVYFKRTYDGEARSMLANLVDTPTCGDDGRMLIVCGETHVGKSSTIARAIGMDSELRRWEEEGGKALVRVKLDGLVDLKFLGRAILAAAGYPLQSDLNPRLTWERVRQQLEFRKVKVLWIDEAQHMFKERKDGDYTDKQYVEEITNHLKGLMKDDRSMSVILSGLPRLKEPLEKDGQVTHLGNVIDIPLLNRDDVKFLWDSIKTLAETIDVTVDDQLLGQMPRLMHAASYSWGFALRLATEALLDATAPRGVPGKVPEPDGVLRLEHFVATFARARGGKAETNPFVATDWERLDCSKLTPQEADAAVSGIPVRPGTRRTR